MRNTDAIAKIIRDLLNRTVGNGNTEAEAMEAIAKAHELLAKYRLDMGDIAEPVKTEEVERSKRGAVSTAIHLMTRVGEYCDCKAWKLGNQPRFTGRENDILFATWLLEALDAFCARRVLEYTASVPLRGRNGAVIESFRVGLCTRINERLREAVAARPRAERNEVEKRNALAISATGIKLAKRAPRRIAGNVDRDHFGAGRAVGDAARFDRPVGGGRPVHQIAS